MPCQSAEPHVPGSARFIVTQFGVTVTFMICCPYDASRKKFATLSVLVVITCCICDDVKLGAVVLSKFAMMTRTLFAVAALVIASVVAVALVGSASTVMRSGARALGSRSAGWPRTRM